MPSISVIILAKNVAAEILPALKTASRLSKDIILVDTGSTDDTIKLSRPYVATLVQTSGHDFSKWRNIGAANSTADWLLYLDSDERLTPKLIAEINRTIAAPKHAAYTIARLDVILGKHLPHWGDSRVLRLIKRDSLVKWQGRLHEQPRINGTIGNLFEPMVHLTHKNIDEKVKGTLRWSRLEADLLLKANHPPMKGWRFIRVMLTEFWRRAVRQRLWLDGTEGWIEIIYQMFSVFITYVRLWELQHQPSLKKTYQQIDRKILADFKTS